MKWVRDKQMWEIIAEDSKLEDITADGYLALMAGSRGFFVEDWSPNRLPRKKIL
jgi:hypothetical protein